MRYLIAILLIVIILSSCGKNVKNVKITNTLDLERKNALVVLDFARLFPNFSVTKTTRVSVLNNGNPIPTQWSFDHRLIILLSCKPYETKTLSVSLNNGALIKSTQRAHAEISIRKDAEFTGKKWVGGRFVNVTKCTVDKKHFIHDALIRYEGPGLESAKIAYRIYLDKRNAMDVFGKKTSKIILPIVGHDTSATYHKMNTWGMDILKVGPTFGAGSFGLFQCDSSLERNLKNHRMAALPKILQPENTDSMICTILEDGPLRAGFRILYKGWKIGNQKVDVAAEHFIQAGSYVVRNEIELLNGQNIGMAFGIMEPPTCSSYVFTKNGYWKNVLGIHSLAGDSLNVFFYFNPKNVKGYDAHLDGNSVVMVPSGTQKITFWSGALWQGNFKGENFKNVCNRFAKEESACLANPLRVEYPLTK